MVFPDLGLKVNWFFTFNSIDVRNIWVILFCKSGKSCFCWKLWMLFYVSHNILLKIDILDVFFEKGCPKNFEFDIGYGEIDIEGSRLMIYFSETDHRNIVYYWYFSLVCNCKSFGSFVLKIGWNIDV